MVNRSGSGLLGLAHRKCRLKKICIILPTYNEKDNLQRLIAAIQDVLRSHELAVSAIILVVDDNSPDGTGHLAEELAKKYGNIQVLHRRAKLGIGSAYRQGFAYAFQKLEPDIIFQMDADLSHNPRNVPHFLAKIEEGYDVVVGSRRVPGGNVINWSFNRYFLSFVANQLARQLCGIKVYDATSGYRAFTRRALQKVAYSSIMSEGYAFQIEMLFKCQKEGLKIAEIPITFVGRKIGKTKLSKSEMLNFLFTCLRLLFRRGTSF